MLDLENWCEIGHIGDNYHSSGEEDPVSSTSCPVLMMAVGSFHWGSEAGTAVGKAWG